MEASKSVLLVDLSLDLEKLLRIPGGQFGVEFLQFNGQPSNDQAGVVAGYNSLTGPPAARSAAKLNELWWRQRPVRRQARPPHRQDRARPSTSTTCPAARADGDHQHFIPAVTGSIYTPVFKNPTPLGEAALGTTTRPTASRPRSPPPNDLYFSYGIFDGNRALGEQTGLNGRRSSTATTSRSGKPASRTSSEPAKAGHPRCRHLGPTGKLTAAGDQEDGANGFYPFGSQRLWFRQPGLDNSGISGFFQFGINDSDTLPVNKYFGTGLTAFGSRARTTERHPRARASRCPGSNENLGFRSSEVMLAAYYQAHVWGDIYVQPTLTHVPNPGQSRTLSPATAISLRRHRPVLMFAKPTVRHYASWWRGHGAATRLGFSAARARRGCLVDLDELHHADAPRGSGCGSAARSGP